MPNYQTLYTLMFNAATDALVELDRLNLGTLGDILRSAQREAEERYLAQTEEEEPPEA